MRFDVRDVSYETDVVLANEGKEPSRKSRRDNWDRFTRKLVQAREELAHSH
jgi:hypothetical protein